MFYLIFLRKAWTWTRYFSFIIILLARGTPDSLSPFMMSTSSTSCMPKLPFPDSHSTLPGIFMNFGAFQFPRCVRNKMEKSSCLKISNEVVTGVYWYHFNHSPTHWKRIRCQRGTEWRSNTFMFCNKLSSILTGAKQWEVAIIIHLFHQRTPSVLSFSSDHQWCTAVKYISLFLQKRWLYMIFLVVVCTLSKTLVSSDRVRVADAVWIVLTILKVCLQVIQKGTLLDMVHCDRSLWALHLSSNPDDCYHDAPILLDIFLIPFTTATICLDLCNLLYLSYVSTQNLQPGKWVIPVTSLQQKWCRTIQPFVASAKHQILHH